MCGSKGAIVKIWIVLILIAYLLNCDTNNVVYEYNADLKEKCYKSVYISIFVHLSIIFLAHNPELYHAQCTIEFENVFKTILPPATIFRPHPVMTLIITAIQIDFGFSKHTSKLIPFLSTFFCFFIFLNVFVKYSFNLLCKYFFVSYSRAFF